MTFNRLKQSSVAVMVVIVFSKFVGMTRDIFLANYYGTSSVSDAYLIASSVPTLIFYFIGHSLSTCYLPIYSQVESEKGKERALYFSNNLLNICLMLSVILVCIINLFPNVIVKLFASGFNPDTAAITATLIRLSSFSLFFMTLSSIFTGFLNFNRNFIIPAAISLPRNISIILSIVVSYYFGFKFLGLGLLLAYLLEFCFLVPFAIHDKYKYRPFIDLKDEYLKKSLPMILPIFFSVAVGQFNKIIDKSIASRLVEGGVSALSYASIINTAISEIFVTGILTIMFASCSKWVAEHQHEKVKLELRKTINNIIFFLVPATFGILVLAKPVVLLILGRGQFDESSLTLTSLALRGYTISLVAVAVRDTFIKVFYAYKDTKTTTIVSTISIALNITLNLLLYRYLGIFGLALSTSISALFGVVALYVMLKRKIGDFGSVQVMATGMKSILASIFMCLIVILLFNFFLEYSKSNFFALIISALSGAVAYFIFSIILRNIPFAFLLKK